MVPIIGGRNELPSSSYAVDRRQSGPLIRNYRELQLVVARQNSTGGRSPTPVHGRQRKKWISSNRLLALGDDVASLGGEGSSGGR
jgi:hypothetical protein